MLTFLIASNKMLANTFTEGEYIKNAYINRIPFEGQGLYSQIRFIVDSENNKVLYCLEPFRTFINNKDYDIYTNNYQDILDISLDTWLKIEAYAYFGYLYEGHTDPIWYAVSQLLIWRTISPDADIYFTDKINGKRTDKYDNLIAELESLVSSYLALPSFSSDIELNLGDKLTLPLNGYIVLEQDDAVKMIDDKLIIDANKKIDKEYILQKGGTGINEIYVSRDSQNIFASFGLSPLTTNLHLRVNAGNITVNFQKEDEVYSSCRSSKENIFGLYDYKGNLIEEINVDEIDSFQSKQLPYGKYYLKQISSSCDIKKDMHKYEVEISKTNENPFLTIDLEEIKCLITINKKYGDNDVYYPESNAKFAISDTEKAFYFTTNEEGIIEFLIGAGEYKISQLTGKENYEFINDYNILVNQSTDILQFDFKDYPLKANLEVLAVDNMGNTLKDVFLTLKSSDGTILTGTTDDKGIFQFNNIILGNYILSSSEVSGYEVLDNIDFVLQEDMQIILEYEKIIIPEVVDEPLEEEPVVEEIEIPNTASNLNTFWTLLTSIILFLGMYINYED